jgi:AAA domain
LGCPIRWYYRTSDPPAIASLAWPAGAKLILAGDDRQLASIERGGMFETLRQQFGAAVLKEVWRVRDAEQKAAIRDAVEPAPRACRSGTRPEVSLRNGALAPYGSRSDSNVLGCRFL